MIDTDHVVRKHPGIVFLGAAANLARNAAFDKSLPISAGSIQNVSLPGFDDSLVGRHVEFLHLGQHGFELIVCQRGCAGEPLPGFGGRLGEQVVKVSDGCGDDLAHSTLRLALGQQMQ